VSCEPVRPCAPTEEGLRLVPPPPGQRRLTRRVGEFHSFLRSLIADAERQPLGSGVLGGSWDIEGDPRGSMLARLWAFVAEGVAAYSELTAGEAYLATAADWTDLRRLGGLVGYRPRPRIAAQGWVAVDIDKGSSPLVPAGTRVQAAGTPSRPAQTFEVIEDTQLRADWAGLTATLVPQPAAPTKPDERKVRFLGDPGFRQGDRVLFVLEQAVSAPPSLWFKWWGWMLAFFGLSGVGGAAQAVAVAAVVGRKDELGTALVEFDRDLDTLQVGKPYAAYRIRATAGAARRVQKVLRIPAAGAVQEVALGGGEPFDSSGKFVVLDTLLEDLSHGQLVAVVDWGSISTPCDVAPVEGHRPENWEVTPGTSVRASRLQFATGLETLKGSTSEPKTIYVLDRRVPATHHVFPPSGSPGPTRLRLFPAPEVPPPRVAVETAIDGEPTWEAVASTPAADQEATGAGDVARGLIVDLVDGPLPGAITRARASANLVRVRHGATASAVLGNGDAALARQRFTLPDAPIAYDLDANGNPVPSQVLRVDGLKWDELPSLYAAGPAAAFAVRLAEDGGVTVEFGDGEQGARLPTGRGNVTSTYRVGGGTVGEVRAGAISALLGSVRGVKKVTGAGPTAGGADQDDARDLRRLAPARARALGRAVSLEDLADLALGFPGVSHAVSWVGAGPPGCACGGSGIHLAFLRAGAVPRQPLGPEVRSLVGFVDARRDATVPLCVCPARVTSLVIGATLAADPRRESAAVSAAARAALLDPDGPLGPLQRVLGQPLDRSDVVAVLHSAVGVTGVSSLTLPGAGGELGRRPADRFELLLVDAASVVQAVSA
jgi:hypothetical protein